MPKVNMSWSGLPLKVPNPSNDNQLGSNHCISLQWKHLKSSELDKEHCHKYTGTKKRKKNVFWLLLSYRASCLNWLLDA